MAAPESYDVELFQAMSLKAIAYKLDEISKKLDKTDAPNFPCSENMTVNSYESCMEAIKCPQATVSSEYCKQTYKR